MLLRDLTIENYRSFENYKLDGLARVNLLVGDNNCGKTSVLEAAYLLVTYSSRDSIWSLLQSRGEIGFVYEGVTQTDPIFVVRLSELFRGFTIAGKSVPRLSVSSSGHGEIRLTLGSNAEANLEMNCDAVDFGVKFETLAKSVVPNVNNINEGVLYARFMGSGGRSVLIQQLTNEGGMRQKTTGESLGSRFWSAIGLGEPIAEFLPMSLANAESVKADWVRVLKNQRDRKVVDALRVVLPEVKEVFVLPTPMSPPQARSHVLIRTNGSNYSLSRLGEGANRLLTLGVSLANSSGGFLFVDEIDTGLHYSKLSDMWRMVITAAKDLGVQVFATTHSLDCIRALEAACDEDQTLRDEVALFSIDRRMDEAVRYGGDELSAVVAHEIEVR